MAEENGFSVILDFYLDGLSFDDKTDCQGDFLLTVTSYQSPD